jgi:hypothetical protein
LFVEINLRWLVVAMSKKDDLVALATPEANDKVSLARVDINHLLARARKRKDKEDKENLVFFSLFTTFIIVVGIFLSF